jgi:hypothetical protein
MLYPLSYERWLEQYTVAGALAALPVLHAFSIAGTYRLSVARLCLNELGLMRRLGLMSRS